MVKLTTHKTSFAAGEISSFLLGRGDLIAYKNGAKKLLNVYVHPTGGISRRQGTLYIDTALGKGRLISFEFNTEQVYLLVMSDLWVDVYLGDVKVAGFATPWTELNLNRIFWVQTADTLLIVHPDIPPKKITRTSNVDWSLDDWSYFENTETPINRFQQPMHKFAAPEVTLQASATTGTVTLTASADLFVSDHIGTRFRIANKEVEIATVTSLTVATAAVKETLADTNATKDWEEQSFSATRGWPTSVCFHQDRMVIGGSRDLPNRLWLSKSSDLFNFDLGEGLDDEGIEFAILSDQVNAISALFSGRHLQVLTSGAEWMVSGTPLTPTNIQLNRQTRIGSPIDRTVLPCDIDGATIFIPRSGPGLREFLFADVEQAYQANNLATLAEHLIDTPVDQDYSTSSRTLYLVMENGTLAMLTIYRAEQVTAWTLNETDGLYRSVTVSGDTVYVLIERDGVHMIERFDDSVAVDSGLTGTSGTPKLTWSGLDHLEGKTVNIVGDGTVREDAIVSGGSITLSELASDVAIGLPFSHEIEPLPPFVQSGQGGNQGGRLRPVSITFRLKDSASLRLDTGRGLQDVSFKSFNNALLDAPPSPFSGDITIRSLGWRRDGTKTLWRIKQDTPLPFTLLSVATKISVNA